MVVNLRDLRPGQKGKVNHVKGKGAIFKRLLDMGITPGSLIEMMREAPLGDPIEIKLRGYYLMLRKKEAAQIVVALV